MSARLSTLTGLAVVTVLAPAAAAQQAAFDQFFGCAEGQWTAEITDFDTSGDVEWSGQQVRVFERILNGMFVQESALSLTGGRAIGLHLYGNGGSEVSMSGFWIMSRRRFSEMEGAFEPDPAHDDPGIRLVGEIRSEPPGGDPFTQRAVMAFEADGALVWKNYAEDGRLDEQIVYRRAEGEAMCFGAS